MFKISKLTFVSKNDETFDYNFSNGLNYFVGGNNTGKTEFYKLLDFMFGHEMYLDKIDCYKDLISEIRIELEYNNSFFTFVRTTDIDKNFIFNTQEGQNIEDVLSSGEYRNRLNTIFTSDEETLRDLREFAEEDLGFRHFTMFNFLDEKSQGKTQDFLSKCNQLEYSLRLSTILNFIFNKNLNEIKSKEQEIKKLQKQLEGMESAKSKSDFILATVNKHLRTISPNIYYTGKNREEVKAILVETKAMNTKIKASKNKDIADLELMFNSLSEQIKRYKNEIADMTEIQKYDTNRSRLLLSLKELIKNQPELDYLIRPLETLLNDLDTGIAFGDYIIRDDTVKKLEMQLEGIKHDITLNDSRFKIYSLPDKEKAVAIIEDYLTSGIEFTDEEEINKIKKEISKLKKDIRTLQNSDDTDAINKFSNYITSLYLSLKGEVNFVDEDCENDGFKIRYIKKGNVLQPVRIEQDNIEHYYYPGSMARHIVIQLCGYAAFLSKLLKEKKYPIIPIFVIDHISKPFDEQNCKAIGEIIFRLLDDVGTDNMQIFMFDSENSDNLGIDNKYSTNLVTTAKSGFCPFYKQKDELKTQNTDDATTDKEEDLK